MGKTMVSCRFSLKPIQWLVFCWMGFCRSNPNFPNWGWWLVAMAWGNQVTDPLSDEAIAAMVDQMLSHEYIYII